MKNQQMKPLHEWKYTVACDCPETREMTATELEALLLEGESACNNCDGSYVVEDEFELRCHVCEQPWPISTFEEAILALDDECQVCGDEDIMLGHFHVPDSWYDYIDRYDWMRSGRSGTLLRRKGRTDYWEGLIHFCEAHEFISIYESGRIMASPTGYFKAPAVCLTEATQGNWKELQDKHGTFGFVFSKKAVLVAGGGPVLYMQDSLINAQQATGFASALKPFVNVIRTRSTSPNKSRHDFLHEREWRVPADILFLQVRPFAVVLGPFSGDTPNWRRIVHAAMEFEELDDSDP